MDGLTRPTGWRATASRGASDEDRRQHRRAFQEASAWVLRQCGAVDGRLARGGLDTQAAERCLQAATGLSVRDPQGWGPIYVRAVSNRAAWPDDANVREHERWAHLSARAFLETAASLGSSVEFEI